MKNILKNIFLIISLVLISEFGFSQSKEIKVKFIGNCSLFLTDGGQNIYIDFPYKSGAHGYMKYDKSEIDSIKSNPVFIFTHRHSDHYSKKLLKKLKGKKYGPWNLSKLDQLNDPANEFSIQSFKTKHIFSLKHYSYLITWHKKKIFISGDTNNADTIAKISNIDWAFMPAWLTMDSIKKNLKLDVKMVGLYHIGPKDKITTENPIILLLDKQGEVISIPY
jgi:L-ascorbate metabolism protein UlaG (beta-lactamase superfamily)